MLCCGHDNNRADSCMTELLSRIGVLLALLLAGLTSTGALAQDATRNSALSVAISPVENGVEFVLTNNGAETISVLGWETPFEQELTQDLFDVSASDGDNKSIFSDRALFSGRLIRRGRPQIEDFISLVPGQSMSATIPLADYYQLTDYGQHHVSFRGVFFLQNEMASPSEELQAISLKTESILVNLEPALEVRYARASGFESCSAAQQSVLTGDFDTAEQLARVARQALESLPENERAGSPRYLKWFGRYNSDFYTEALDTYKKSEALMGQGAVEFLCDCSGDFFAFIKRTEPYKVHLCELYWGLPATGIESRAGIILHEVSHFSETGNTRDHAYGAPRAAALARDNPRLAVDNAANIEYFAENTPFVEISAGVVTPMAPPAPTTFTELATGTQVTGSVFSDESDGYRVTGADEIILTTTNGDADLYVYSESDATGLLCAVANSERISTCALPPSDTIYISVAGYNNANYSIVANSNSVPLQLGQTQTVSITAGDSRYFTVSGANFVQINSLSGDADLYVFSEPSRSVSSQECSSRNFSANSTFDTCTVNSTKYISVFGVADGQFTITSSTDDPRTDPDPVAVDTGGTDTGNTYTDGANTGTTDTGTDVTTVVVMPQTSTNGGGNSSGGGGLITSSVLLVLLLPLYLRRRIC